MFRELRNQSEKGAKIRNRYNQVPYLTQDTTWGSDKTQLNTTNESQEVSPFTQQVTTRQSNEQTRKYDKHKT